MGGGQKYSIIFFTFLISLFFSCQNYSVSDEGIDQDSDDSSSQKVEIFTEGGLKYAIINRSVAIYGLDDNTDRVNLVIPAEINGIPVTEIAENAFYEEKAIASVEIPESLVKIGKYAFYKCTSLSKIELPKNVKSIEHAFVSCTSLSEVTLNDGIEDITSAFYDDSNIKSIRVPSSVVSMDNAFGYCTELTDVVLEEGLTVVSGFYNCFKLEEIKIPSSVKKVGQLSGTAITQLELPEGIEEISSMPKNLKSLELPKSLKTIVGYTFENSSLTELKLPDGLVSIGGYAFKNSEIQNIVIPESVKTIGEKAFENTNIKYINIPRTWTQIDEDFFGYSNIEEVYIPENIKNINCELFKGCDHIKKVTIACNLDEDIYGVEDGPLASRCLLNFTGEYIEVEETVKYEPWTDSDGVYYEGGEETVTTTKFLGVDLIFEDSVSVVSGKIISGYFKSIDFGANASIKDFSNTYPVCETMVFNNPDNTFTYCEFFSKQVRFDADVRFNGCTFYTQEVFINTDLKQMDEKCVFKGKLEGTYSDDGDDYYYAIPEDVDDYESELVIADNVTVIPAVEFKGHYFSNMQIPDSIIGVFGDYPFMPWLKFVGCTLNLDFKIGNWQDGGKFGEISFDNCDINGTLSIEEGSYTNWNLDECNIKRLEIPDFGLAEKNQWSYDRNANWDSGFGEEGKIRGCHIKELYFSANPPMHLFTLRATPAYILSYSCDSTIEKIELSPNVTMINKYMFWQCKGLKEIDLSNVTFIGEMAFQDCTDLEKVTFGSMPTVIEANAFNGCSNAEFVFNGPVVMDINSKYCFAKTNLKELPEVNGIIPAYAFSESHIENFVYPSNSDTSAFYNFKFDNIIIPEGNSAIYKDGILYGSSVRYQNNPQGDTVDFNEGKLRVISVINKELIPENLVIPDEVAEVNDDFKECKNLKTILAPNVTHISGFEGCTNLISVTAPKCKFIYSRAFYGCENLETFYSDVVGIWFYESCFEGCKKLEAVYSGKFKNIIAFLDHKSFKDCSSLKEISFTKNNSMQDYSYIYEDSFQGCTSLEKIYCYLDRYWWESYKNAWSTCSSLEKKITIYNPYEYMFGDTFIKTLEGYAKQFVHSSERDAWEVEPILISEEEFKSVCN